MEGTGVYWYPHQRAYCAACKNWASDVRNGYLPEHQPLPHTYKSHFKSRVPPHCVSQDVCNCGRFKQVDGDLCRSCLQSQDIVNSELSLIDLEILENCATPKPIEESISRESFEKDAD